MTGQNSTGTAAVAPAADTRQLPVSTEPLPEGNELEVGYESDIDSAFDSDGGSETTSITSAIYRGYMMNGRRYQSGYDKEYYMPADDKQFDAMAMLHLMYLILDSQAPNPLFRSPLPSSGAILDLGCGNASWAIDVADTFPHLLVHGVDLTPSPETWLPPNCVLEVDDVSKPWTWGRKWELVHMRYLVGAFCEGEWEGVYREAFGGLVEGGWIEQIEGDIGFFCDDDSLPLDSVLRTHRERFFKASARAGRPLDTTDKMRTRIEAAGFKNVHVQEYKLPLGAWAKHPIHRDAGRVKLEELKEGLEGTSSSLSPPLFPRLTRLGYALFLLTKFGDEKPWSVAEAQALLAQMWKDIENPKYHIYQKATRVWAQKGHGGEEKEVDVMDIVNVGWKREHHNHFQGLHHHAKHGEEKK